MGAMTWQDNSGRSLHAVIRVYNDAGDVIETHEYVGEFNVMLTLAWGQPPFALMLRSADLHGAGRASDQL